MTLAAAKTGMKYEEMPGKVSKSSVRKIVKTERTVELQKIAVTEFAWAKAKQHKFGLLLTFTIVYVAFSMFGTLIIGLLESL